MVNLAPIQARNAIDIRARATATLAALPERALVFGLWGGIVPLEYLHLLEGTRPDVTLRNLFFFRSQAALLGPIALETADETRAMVFLSNRAPLGISSRQYTIAPFRVRMPDGNAPETVGYLFEPIPP